MIGLRMPRPLLDGRINHRVDEQIAQGLVEEVRGLIAAGVQPAAPAMQGLGCKELAPYLDGRLPLEAVMTVLKRNTRRYARRQETWFRRDSRIHWLDVGHAAPEVVAMTIRAMLAMTAHI